MTIDVRFEHADGKGNIMVSVIHLEGVKSPTVWNNAFMQFNDLDGRLVWMLPLHRLVDLKFSDNALELVTH